MDHIDNLFKDINSESACLLKDAAFLSLVSKGKRFVDL